MWAVAKKYIADYPSITTVACLLVPAAAWFIYQKADWRISLKTIDHAAVGVVYVGLGSVAAICGGFAGVIIVFGLTPTSDLFRRFRISAGERMSANWISIITNAFFAAGVAIAAAVLEVLNFHTVGVFVFGTGCLLLIHSFLRSIWILRQLLTLVRNDDRAARNQALGRLNP
jgi:hypothetical protein